MNTWGWTYEPCNEAFITNYESGSEKPVPYPEWEERMHSAFRTSNVIQW